MEKKKRGEGEKSKREEAARENVTHDTWKLKKMGQENKRIKKRGRRNKRKQETKQEDHRGKDKRITHLLGNTRNKKENESRDSKTNRGYYISSQPL